MLSVIISSNSAEYLQKIKRNVEETIGVPYELIAINNNGEFGLCWAYNKGAAGAAYDFLCFVHHDVLFHTNNWGRYVIDHLSSVETGVIGVMGGRYKSASGLGWRDGKTDFYRYRSKSSLEEGKILYFNPGDDKRSRVVCLDGVFLCCRKQVWQQFLFDEMNFKGFHFYDMDFSFRVAQHLRNFMVNDILLEHFSHGNMNKEYLLDSLIFEKKHKQQLPFTIEELSKKQIGSLEGYSLTEKLRLMKKNGFGFYIKLKLVGRYFFRYFNVYQLARNLYFGVFKS